MYRLLKPLDNPLALLVTWNWLEGILQKNNNSLKQILFCQDSMEHCEVNPDVVETVLQQL